jgi:hypothetical protein
MDGLRKMRTRDKQLAILVAMLMLWGCQSNGDKDYGIVELTIPLDGNCDIYVLNEYSNAAVKLHYSDFPFVGQEAFSYRIEKEVIIAEYCSTAVSENGNMVKVVFDGETCKPIDISRHHCDSDT